MVVWQRTLTIYVDVLAEWLLPDEVEYDEVITDEMVITADAWEELRRDVTKHLQSLYHGQPGFPNRFFPQFVYVEWEDKPDKDMNDAG